MNEHVFNEARVRKINTQGNDVGVDFLRFFPSAEHARSPKEGVEKFRIEYNPHPANRPKARGAHNAIVFSDVFDKGRHPGGELRFAKSLIHHEFGHTKFGHYKDVPSIQDERIVTIKYSNPVRVYHNYEPRYTYTHPRTQRTISILDPNKIFETAMTVKEDDPRILMKLNTPGARKWPK